MKRYRRRFGALALTSVLVSCAVFPIAACAKTDRPDGTRSLDPLDLVQIPLARSASIQAEDDRYIVVLMPAGEGKTGETVTVRTAISDYFSFPVGSGQIYYVVDWGDGTWSYNGPALQDDNYKSVVSHRHAYREAGEYSVRAAAYSMTSETVVGWSAPKTFVVKGETKTPDNMLKRVEAISSGSEKKRGAELILDGRADTAFVSKWSEKDEIDEKKYVGLLFDRNYTMDKVEIQISASAEVFPSNINIEYTTDFGKTWFSFPKYYYLYPYAVGRFNPIMNFPNPKGATLSLPLDGMCANGIRIASELWPVYGADVGKDKKLEISEMRAYGDEEMLFQTSNDDKYNADLNNMWTIYGTANTEPLVVGSLKGETTNANPFRTGFKLIAVSEWLDWQSQKYSWMAGQEAENAEMIENLKEVTVAGDGWSDYAGYVWSDRDYPKHFNVQNHYEYNALFILGAANYILSGNYGKLLDINNREVSVFDIENKRGDTLWDRLQRAMTYQLETLHGRTGILTIDDPNNQGLRDSVASSYMDEYNFDGYMSVSCNLYFYRSLLAMADIYDYRAAEMGDVSAAGKAAELRAIAQLSRRKINEVFWNDDTGRFIISIDCNGRKFDMGATYINTIASAFGIPYADKAQSVYSWLDGTRIVESDLSATGGSVGADIYAFKVAPRTNTVDIYNLSEGGSGTAYWWTHDGLITTDPGAWAGWGNNQMNGGHFFWNSSYDIQGRAMYLGADNAYARFGVIMEEFAKDQLRRYPFSPNNGADAGYIEGIIGEYPESGTVPLVYLNTFLGVNLQGDGVRIRPNLPSSLTYACVSRYMFGGREYSIRVDRNATRAYAEFKEGKYFLTLPADGDYTITYDNRFIRHEGGNGV